MSEKNESKQWHEDKVQQFLCLLTANQHRIYSFIMSFVVNWSEADDIYQETASVLWRKFDEFEPETNFLSWAFKIAHFQILSHNRNTRNIGKHFSHTTLENIKEIAYSSVKERDDNLGALRECIKKLYPMDRKLLTLRYENGATVKNISRQLQKSVNTLYKEYRRIHVLLFNCIREQLDWDTP